MEEKEWLEKAEKSIINQPIEGLLYDLDLMPEQCKSSHSNVARLVITRLREEIERLKKVVDNKVEIQILEAERDHEEIEGLRECIKKSLGQFSDGYVANGVITLSQALKEATGHKNTPDISQG